MGKHHRKSQTAQIAALGASGFSDPSQPPKTADRRSGGPHDRWRKGKKRLKCLIGLPRCSLLCYAETAMRCQNVLRLEGPGARESEPRMLLKTQGVGKITCESRFGFKASGQGCALRCVWERRRTLAGGVGDSAGQPHRCADRRQERRRGPQEQWSA